MHSLRLVHRDVKFSNILYSQNSKCCMLSDFGLSHFVREEIGEKSHAYFEGT
jgi:serine/threonine protein kinase